MTENVLMKALVDHFLGRPDELELLRAVLRGKVRGVSLRLLDYLVTNFSRSNNTVYKTSKGDTVHLYREYKSQLRGYSKRQFDPFARRERVLVDFPGGAIETTTAQLNFFRWAFGRGVVDYAAEKASEIETFYSASKNIEKTNKVHLKSAEKSPSSSSSEETRRSGVLSFV
jgi:hypothetical protein